MQESDSTASSRSSATDIAALLPFQLVKSDIIPPVPNRSETGCVIDWLSDFAGYAWVAYGASSLLVISHFPNPLSDTETIIGSVFRQVFELSVDGSSSVSAVSWSPATPSTGDLAAALDNCIGLFSYNPDTTDNSSFCWSQTAMLVQSTKVEGIQWTGSGDGIIACGSEVFLWRKKEITWEIAWKFKPKLPHSLVSATWSIDGLSATAVLGILQVEASCSHINEASKNVLVSIGDGNNRYVQVELRHPLPVSMIQWRPATGKQPARNGRHLPRPMLLTCCLDGAVRLWSEIDDVRARRSGKESNDHRALRFPFRVVAVIEVNQVLNGCLGSNIFIRWAAEIDAVITLSNEVRHFFPSEEREYDKAGRCEWLVCVGPKMMVSFWAIHCLDDFAPLRFPRVTLWKKQESGSVKDQSSGLLLDRAFIMRNQVFSPPVICSFVKLLSCNSLSWFHLYSETIDHTQEGSPDYNETQNLLTSSVEGTLDIDSHSGKILQIVVHPYFCEVELAASLDAKGSLLFWTPSLISNNLVGLPALTPTWDYFGNVVISDSLPKYSSLKWAPPILNDDRFLLMGHGGGIDCFAVKIVQNEEKEIVCHNLCTIPFTAEGHLNGPNNVFAVPLSSCNNKTSISNTFLLLAVWNNNFQVLSWKITIHHCDLPGSCCYCGFDMSSAAENNCCTSHAIFSCKRYCVSVVSCSSALPAAHNGDEVSSVAVISPSGFALSEEQELSSSNSLCGYSFAYHMVTGYSDGSIKLWRYMPADLASSKSEWDLVGMLAAHEGPVILITSSACGQKIASVSRRNLSKGTSTIHIWECVHIEGTGCFMLEDTLHLDGKVVALDWLSMGNGKLLLGVCCQNELRVYAQKRCKVSDIWESEGERNIWICVAASQTFPVIRDFFWGPKMTMVIVHDEYFCVYNQLLVLADEKFLAPMDRPPERFLESNKHKLAVVFSDTDICQLSKSSAHDDGGLYSPPFVKMNVKHDIISNIIESTKEKFGCDANVHYWSISEVVEKLGGPLPLFHPVTLLINISAGNWRRASFTLQHVASSGISAQQFCFGKSSHDIQPIPLKDYLEGGHSSISNSEPLQWSINTASAESSSWIQEESSKMAPSWGYNSSTSAFSSSSTSSQFANFTKALGKSCDAAGLTSSEKLQIDAIVKLLQEVSDTQSTSAYGCLDEAGRRFWVAVRFQQLYYFQKFGRLPFAGDLVINSRLIGWAFHSDCQENLFNSLLSSEPSWEEMRNMGVGYWYTNTTELRMKVEKLARQQYLKNRDPKSCTLLYIVLNRLQVLAGLFKISKDDKDRPLVAFLSRNFQEDKNKAAALKNAYVLMGKHQLELAVAFFLLGGDTYSAVNVCAKNLGDEQLALVICRLVEGYGGPLECQLISKLLLPTALSKGDYWLASILEWILGNCSEAFLRMLGVDTSSLINKSAISSSHSSFSDPSIGQYSLMLATKTRMKNAVGDKNAAILGRWAILMSATSLTRCGLPLEALECLTSSLSLFGGSTRESGLGNANPEVLTDLLNPSPYRSTSNWISGNVAIQMESNAKLAFAMQYISELLKEYPSLANSDMASFGSYICAGSESKECGRLLQSFQDKLTAVLACFQQKFSLIPFHLLNMSALSLRNKGLPLMGYSVMFNYISQYLSGEEHRFDGILSYPILPKLLLKLTEEVSRVFTRYTAACSISCYHHNSISSKTNGSGKDRFSWLSAWKFYKDSLIWILWYLRTSLSLLAYDHRVNSMGLASNILDLSQYYAIFASAWLQRNSEDLLLIAEPPLSAQFREDVPNETEMENLNKNICDVMERVFHNSAVNEFGAHDPNGLVHHEEVGDLVPLAAETERWQVVGASLWVHLSDFVKHQLKTLSDKFGDSVQATNGPHEISALISKLDSENAGSLIRVVPAFLSTSLQFTCEHISSYCTKQLASDLLQKVDINNLSALLSLEDTKSLPKAQGKHTSQSMGSSSLLQNTSEMPPFEKLWYICGDLKLIRGSMLPGNSKYMHLLKQRSTKEWADIYHNIMMECQADESGETEDGLESPSSAVGSPITCLAPNDHPFANSGAKDANKMKKVAPFHIPKEIHKRNGELLEALCTNSINQHQAALASNRKGIIFFNLGEGPTCSYQSEYVWAKADWPLDGFAGSESTPVPTCVSPGVGLGSKKGAHLGLGGATVGAWSLARAGRDFSGGGAFGFPGYAGPGTSGLGWGIQEDFDESVDPLPTVENVRTRAFSTHPSRPLFLVGSSNTHIYLWEFGKDKATATYGVLPAANVPPPYALASISAVRFDHCGHRFVTAALDGTVCAWQLEVGGRSNVRPTESCVCFNNHTSDVTYVTASGSIIAAAGYSSSGINVVIWDTLAPPATSRASIMCHEGGARSLSVFDNDIGTGSVSPLIVTGGKAGDVGLHDFRYIATGRTKRHKYSDTSEQTSTAASPLDLQNKTGDQNRNGMLWYIPRAHAGSVTKISTIPNTSFFLTGSKDGDVKLWDAKMAKLVFHWPKLHERHTFLQPSSRSFGGMVRAGVTDIQITPDGFLSCGGDGTVKLIKLKDSSII